jgi:serine/threonine protein kinase/Tol biopolymer transport system component
MGEVYRALDTRLNRHVALKVLPDSFAQSPDFVARLRREALVLASVNHPHIASIHGIEDDGRVVALVLELVDGPTLADRIARGPIPLHDALAIASQVADALDAAHERGIVHRDLKPANIKVRPDGAVKVLDFGLAKAMGGLADEANTSQSPTVSPAAVTRVGSVVGTAVYMSPEQARGEAVDKRTDIWAFGCLLFEMLSATPAFDGASVSDVIANVLKTEPHWDMLPADAAAIVPILRQCLEKDLRRRFRDIGDVKLLLLTAASRGGSDAERSGTAPVAPSSRRLWPLAAVAAVCLAAGGVLATLLERPSAAPASARVERFAMTTPESSPIGTSAYGNNVAVSPDGSRIVYTATRNGTTALVMRRLDQIAPEPIAGTEGGFDPFFSPDGQTIGFATFSLLKTVPAAGGPSATVCRIDAYFSGGSWASDNTIVFAQASLGLFRVPASGGSPEKIGAPDATKRERGFVRPIVHPGSQSILYTSVLEDNTLRVMARRARGNEVATIAENGFGPQFLSPSVLLYGQGDKLMAVRFNGDTLRAEGTPSSVQDGVFLKTADGVSNFVASANGMAVYVAGREAAMSSDVAWIDQSGKRLSAFVAEQLQYPRNLRLSPDGHRLAMTIGPGGNGQIWVYDTTGAAQPLKLTFRDHNIFPVWSPDGTRIAFLSRSGSASRLLSIPADGSATEPDRITEGDQLGVPAGFSSDGAVMLFQDPRAAALRALRIRDGAISDWANTAFTQFGARVSPDGQWVAFESDQTGTPEIWVRAFSGGAAPVRVSSGGGHKPLWSRDGKDLYFEIGAKVMSAHVLAQGPAFQAGPQRMLFEGGFTRDDTDPYIRFMDIAPDGRFLVVEPTKAGDPASIVIVQHWDEEVKRALR